MLISGKEAAKKAGYSADYIARLAREQKIVGTQIDRQWFIDVESLRHFLNSAKIEKEARKRKLQEERVKERALREERVAGDTDITSKAHKASLETIIASGVVAVVAVLIGTSAVSLYSSLLGPSNNVAQVNIQNVATQGNTLSDAIQPIFTEVTAPVASSTYGEGVLLLSPDTSTATVEKVQGMFSDPVEVTLVDGTTGRVIVEEDGQEVVYPVIIVPKN